MTRRILNSASSPFSGEAPPGVSASAGLRGGWGEGGTLGSLLSVHYPPRDHIRLIQTF